MYDDPIVLHDPLALLVCVGEPVVTTASRPLVVDAPTARCSHRRQQEGREHAVVVAVDASAAVDRVLGLLG